MKPVFQEILDAAQCASPGCDHVNCKEIWLHPRCHIGGGVEVCYDKTLKLARVICHVCKQPVVDIAVAPQSYANRN